MRFVVGDLGAITKMLTLIEGRLQRNVCDEVSGLINFRFRS